MISYFSSNQKKEDTSRPMISNMTKFEKLLAKRLKKDDVEVKKVRQNNSSTNKNSYDSVEKKSEGVMNEKYANLKSYIKKDTVANTTMQVEMEEKHEDEGAFFEKGRSAQYELPMRPKKNLLHDRNINSNDPKHKEDLPKQAKIPRKTNPLESVHLMSNIRPLIQNL